MPAINLIHAMHSDTGRVRRQNEDAFAAAPELGAFVVCDGMGGAAAGEVASSMAASTFLETLAAPGFATDLSTVKVQTRLHTAILEANERIHARSEQFPEFNGMGTTLVALLHVPPPTRDRRSRPRTGRTRFIPPPDLFLANVGDSRCYRLRAGALLQLSTDHSFVEEQLRAGQITADEAAVSPMRNFITRAVGPHTRLEPDIQSYRTLPGDIYLLCSDGLSRELPDEQIASVLLRELPARPVAQEELNQACRALIDAANREGGRDNITVGLLAFF